MVKEQAWLKLEWQGRLVPALGKSWKHQVLGLADFGSIPCGGSRDAKFLVHLNEKALHCPILPTYIGPKQSNIRAKSSYFCRADSAFMRATQTQGMAFLRVHHTMSTDDYTIAL